jgi:hypothetical protein
MFYANQRVSTVTNYALKKQTVFQKIMRVKLESFKKN